MSKLFCRTSLPIWRAAFVLSFVGFLGASYGVATATAAIDELDPIESVGSLDDGGPAGFRYTQLSTRQIKALRRTVTLPLDALFSTDSKRDLLLKADVSPLPDPSAPFLPLEGDATGEVSTNPFEESMSAHAGDALARLFESEGGIDQNEAKIADDPFSDAEAESDPFSPAEEPTDAAPMESVDEQEDAGLEDDPFADF